MTTSENEVDGSALVFQWECPICNKVGTRLSPSQGMGPQGALRSHVFATKGDDHGPQFAYPEDFDAEDLAEYVTGATSD